MIRKVLFTYFLILPVITFGQTYSTFNASVNFKSVAALETIIASSDELQGVLDYNSKSFAFKMYIKSFEGFNSPLQQIHFYENFMETDEYPIAVFKGKILEDIDPENKLYRAKGILSVHGVDIERVININLDIQNKEILFSSEFQLDLDDHKIELPRIVYQKIAESIDIFVEGSLSIRP